MTPRDLDRELDAILGDLAPASPSPALVARILAAAPRPRAARSGLWTRWQRALAPAWPAGAAFASLVFGLGLGFSYTPVSTPAEDAAEATVLAALGFDDELVLSEGSDG